MSNVLTKEEIKKALEDAKCPQPIIEEIGQALLIWWKTGWLQEILLAQKKAGQKDIVEWIEDRLQRFKVAPKLLGFTMLSEDWQAKLKEIL